jgi:membrane-bound serine protease (ClpP class)
MRRVALFSCLFGVLALWPASSLAAVREATGAQAQTTRVVVLKVEGAIDRPLRGYLEDRLDRAEADGAVVVLQIDTSGTLDQDGVALAQRIADLDVPVIAWVGPTPAKASGAGLLLMYASSLAAVAPGSQTGPLDPIDVAEPDRAWPGLDATIQGWLDDRGKDTQLERLDQALPAQGALDLRIASVAAASVPELMNDIDGQTVQTPGGPVVLQTRIATDESQAADRAVDITFDNMGPLQRVAHGVASPSMIYFLLVIGLACIAFELTQPGFGFAGFSGVAMLLLAAYGIWVVPPWWPGMALLLGGIALMIADVRLRRLGVLTAAGLVAFGFGSFLAWKGVDPTIAISPWLIGGAIVASLLYYGFGLTVAIQSRDRIVNTQKGLIGLVGEARGTLSPEGPVFVKGALWRGRTGGDEIAPGTKVRVRGIDGLVLRVEPEPEEVGAAAGPVD